MLCKINKMFDKINKILGTKNKMLGKTTKMLNKINTILGKKIKYWVKTAHLAGLNVVAPIFTQFLVKTTLYFLVCIKFDLKSSTLCLQE